MVISEIIIVTKKSPPAYSISGIEQSTNPIVFFELFLTREEAKAWVQFEKAKSHPKTTFRVEALQVKKILKVVYYSGNKSLIVQLLVPGGNLMNDFKARIQDHSIRTFQDAKLGTQCFKNEDVMGWAVLNRMSVLKPAGTTFGELNE